VTVTTENKQRRVWLPAQWIKTGFTSGQGTGLAMAISGFPAGIKEIALARPTSLVTVGIQLSAAITAGLIRFEITKNGAATGKTVDLTSASGLKAMWEFDPGELTGTKGDVVGVLWGSSGSLAPSGTIDGVIFFEVQDG